MRRERNVTQERGLFYGRKQRDNETFEKFHAELSAIAGQCDFANAAESIRDIFIMNMRESECQKELSRSTKLPEEVYRIALSYERGERAYKSYTGKPTSSAPPKSIKQEPVTKLEKGMDTFGIEHVGDEEDTPQGRVVEAVLTVGVIIATLRILRWTTSRTVLSREQHVTHARNWDISNANVGALEVMSIRKKNVNDVKIPGSRVQVEASERKMWLWVDSGSTVTIISMTDLKTTLDKTNFRLQPSQEEYLDYKNNRIHILGKVAVTISLNGWAAPAQVSVIAGNHQLILGRDLMGTLGLELVQRGKEMGITGKGAIRRQKDTMSYKRISVSCTQTYLSE